jgi:hypothetical protein
MSWKQANSIVNNNQQNAVGTTFSVLNQDVEPFTQSPYDDYFYTQYLVSGCYCFSCNYIIRNNSNTDDIEITRLEFTLDSTDYDDLSQYIYGQTLEPQTQWSFWLNRTFTIPVDSDVIFGVQTHYTGTNDDLERTVFNIRLTRIA